MNNQSKTFLRNRPGRRAFGAAAALLILASGCSTPQPKTPQKFAFFPGAPDSPRIQFLTSYSSEKELRGSSSHFATFITGEEPSDISIGKPYGLALSQHKLYICDAIYKGIVVMDLAARRTTVLPGEGETALAEPVNIAVDPHGTRYVVDSVRNQVLCLDATNQLKWVMGHKDEMKPRDIALTDDRMYVGDVQCHGVRVYERQSRKLLFTIPKPGEAASPKSALLMPCNVAVDRKGQLYVSDIAAGRVQVYDKNGDYVRSLGVFGDTPQFGTIKRAKGVAVDRNGIVYVVDAAYEMVQMFDDQGRYLMGFGYPGSSIAGGMHLPAKVIVDYDNVGLFAKYAAPNFQVEYLLIVSNQYGPRRVAIYGFGHQK